MLGEVRMLIAFRRGATDCLREIGNMLIMLAEITMSIVKFSFNNL